jgi:hypothetical protein
MRAIANALSDRGIKTAAVQWQSPQMMHLLNRLGLYSTIRRLFCRA